MKFIKKDEEKERNKRASPFLKQDQLTIWPHSPANPDEKQRCKDC